MDRRTVFVAIIAVLAGIVAGAVSSLAWQTRSGSVPSNPDTESASSAQLGAQVLGKVSSHFVAHRRDQNVGVAFYDQPKPYGDWLCRVNRYFVPEKTLTGKIVQPQDWWADDLAVEMEYGVWRKPGLGRANDAERHKACHAYRDFDHLFTAAKSGDPERAAFLLDRILTDFRANKLTVPISCEHINGDGTKALCDENKILRSMTLNDLRSIESVSESEVNNGMRRVDRLGLAGAPPSASHYTLLELLVESEQRYGKQSASEGELRSIRLVIEEI